MFHSSIDSAARHDLEKCHLCKRENSLRHLMLLICLSKDVVVGGAVVLFQSQVGLEIHAK